MEQEATACLNHCAYTAPHSGPNGSRWWRPGACRVGWGMGMWSNPFVPHRQLLSSYDLAGIQRNPIKLQVAWWAEPWAENSVHRSPLKLPHWPLQWAFHLYMWHNRPLNRKTGGSQSLTPSASAPHFLRSAWPMAPLLSVAACLLPRGKCARCRWQGPGGEWRQAGSHWTPSMPHTAAAFCLLSSHFQGLSTFSLDS